jgi:hypothetical protein
MDVVAASTRYAARHFSQTILFGMARRRSVSSPRNPEWNWCIMNCGGEIVEESQGGFSQHCRAVTAGTERLTSMDALDTRT